MNLYTKEQILDYWKMDTSLEEYSSYKSYNNSIITMDSCFMEDGSLIPFSPIRRSSINWEKVQVYQTPKNPKAFKTISDAYYINFFHSSHWGHFLTESLARMNSLLCSDLPTRNIIIRFEGAKSLGWVKEIFQNNHYNIIPFSENLLVSKLYLPIPTMVNFHYILKEHIDTLQKYSSYFKHDLNSFPKKVYLSRNKLPKTHRVNFKEDVLEDKLKSYGWEIVHLQDYSIGNQVKILENADSICGCMGSAFHNLMMCNYTPQKIIYLVPEINYIFPNYAAHDTVMNNNSIFLQCQNLSDYNKRNFTFKDPINTAKMIEEIL